MQSKLVLVSGTGDSPKLARNIYTELRDTYNMGDSVSLFVPKKPNEVNKNLVKNRTYPAVLGSYTDRETRGDGGSNILLDKIRGNHAVIVKYMYTPKREPDMHINDHIMEVKALLDVFKHTDTLRKTLAVPYLTYLRSHSIEKYEKKKFYQFDALTDMVESFKFKGLEGIICIDPHSDKIIEKGREFNIEVNTINPFSSTRYTDPSKLGLNDNSEKVLSKLRPFLERFKKIKESKEYKNIKFIFPSLDENAEKRVREFIIDSELFWDSMAYMNKTRNTLGKPIFQIKSFSKINEGSKIKDAVCIGLDDMVDSGGTSDGGFEYLKNKEFMKHSELWVSHPLIPDRKKVKALKNIDKIVALDTIIHKNPEEIKLEYIKCSHHLLAAEIFKAHMKLDEERSSFV